MSHGCSPSNTPQGSSRESSPEELEMYDNYVFLDRNGDPLRSRPQFSEAERRGNLWRTMTARHNVSATGFPLPESGGHGLVRSVSLHNAIGAYAAMMHMEDASRQDSQRPNVEQPETLFKDEKQARTSGEKSTAKPAVPKAPTAATKDSAATPDAGPTASPRPTRTSAKLPSTVSPVVAGRSTAAGPPVPQRTTRSSARLSSTVSPAVPAARSTAAAPVAQSSPGSSQFPTGAVVADRPETRNLRGSGRLSGMPTTSQAQSSQLIFPGLSTSNGFTSSIGAQTRADTAAQVNKRKREESAEESEEASAQEKKLPRREPNGSS